MDSDERTQGIHIDVGPGYHITIAFLLVSHVVLLPLLTNDEAVLVVIRPLHGPGGADEAAGGGGQVPECPYRSRS